MWKDEYYEKTDGGFYRNLPRPIDDGEISQYNDEAEIEYEIIFDFEDQRYYCYVYALNIAEALGLFFMNHNTITYQNIVEHIEV